MIKQEKPKYLDYILINKNDIQIKVFGVLHALTGGTNKEYINFVNDTIKKEKNEGFTVLSEKSMKKMYNNIDKEVDDFVVLKFFDAFKMTCNMMNPKNTWTIIKSIYKEKTTINDRFNIKNPNIADIGGSPYFHEYTPIMRRELAGFKSPFNYLKVNLQRRINKDKITPPIFPDKDWNWLSIIEPFANIPLRSIHMIEYSLEYAKKYNINKISLFVGEIHNSDIEYYINNFDINLFNNDEQKIINKVVNKAKKSVGKNLFLERINYILGIAIPATLIICLYFFILIIFSYFYL